MPVTRRVAAEQGVELVAVDNPNSRRELTAAGLLQGRGGGAQVDGEEGAAQVLGEREGHNVAPIVLHESTPRPPQGGGSHRPQRSSSSRSSARRQLELAERLAAIDEEGRRNRLRLEEARMEAENLDQQRRLLQLRFAVEEEEEDYQLDRQSNVLSVSSGKPDVEAWAENARNISQVEQNDFDSLSWMNLSLPDNSIGRSDCPPEEHKRTDVIPDDSNLGRVEANRVAIPTEEDSLQRMANCFAAAMKDVVKSVKPSGGSDIKNFVARQTGAKDLLDFHGDPEEWPTFIARFKKSTQLCGFSDDENVIRLQKSLKGKAREAVVSMLSTGSNLKDILDVLKLRFGRPDQIIKRMLDKARNAATPTEGDFQSLLDFSIAVKNICATAESLQLPQYLNNPQLVEEFQRKLPSHLQLEWGRSVVRNGMVADLKWMSTFLEEVASAAVVVCQEHQHSKKNRKEHVMVVTDVTCPLKCKKSHHLEFCPSFKKMTIQERWETVRKIRVCFGCLRKGHSRNKCLSSAVCEVDGCKGPHHSLLHYEKKKDGDNAAKKRNGDGTTQADGQPNVIGVVSPVHKPVANVLMKVVPVQLVGPKGRILVNAFLDDGSALTMIDEKIANTLGLEGECKPLHLNWLGGRSESDKDSRLVSCQIRGIDEKNEFTLESVRTKKNLNLPVVPLSNYKWLKNWNHLKDVPFPQVLQQRPALIIGSDHCHLLLARKAVEGPRNAPMASWTHLGWTAHGPSGKVSAVVGHASMVNAENLDPDLMLHEMVKEQFRLEALGVVNCGRLPQSKENARAIEIMENTSRRLGDCFETGMLWKTNDLKLPDSKPAALRRLFVLEKKMDAEPSFASAYEGKIEEYVQKQFARKLSPEEASIDNGRVWYLPHFGRTNPNKPGKLRLVFDGTATVNGTSLNSALLQGPDLMSPLLDVLLKFRQREVAFSGDIRDMFHMVKIRQEDLPALRFLWRGKNRTQPPDVYTMNVMVFGAVSSPFQAQWIKNRNADDFKEEFPEAVDAIHHRHYVDDYLDSCATTEEAIKKIIEVREVHRRGGFEIRGWLSNDSDVLKVVAPGEVANKQLLPVKEDDLERVLGLHWDPKMDLFKFKTTFRDIDPNIIAGEKIPTKRELLRLVMSLFDPLGFVAHLTIRGRILLQDIWRSKIGWDEQLPTESEDKWKSFLNQVLQLSQVNIPRCNAPAISRSDELELHIMCDASQQAFSCVAFLRVTGKTGVVTVNIIMAKARVTPIKCVSIPRLEMEAALMGARMSNYIKKTLDLKIASTTLWTDSKNVLCWIRAEDPSKFRVYIGHRIGEILDLTEVGNWRWVPTASNVADDATRDSTVADVSPTSRWFRGPEFLWNDKDSWPQETSANLKEEIVKEELELKKDCCLVVAEMTYPQKIEDTSSWMRLIRVTAWILRFVRNAKGQKIVNPTLTVKEVKEATTIWIRRVQQSSFPEEYECVKEGRPVSKSSRLVNLSPVMSDGVIVVKSRLCNAPNLLAETKNPPILDPKHPFTKLLVDWYHASYGHHGVELICNEIRQRYWILALKPAVKKAAKNCMQCRLEAAKQIVPEMAPLPEVRVSRPAKPFSFVGIDYFGPMEVVNGRKREKRYGALFTCLSTRAVHLEVAYSLSTDDFLLTLNRFICRRGEPEEIWSDNGTNFRGADKELKKTLAELKQDRIEDQMTFRGIKWNFIPPGAPHMGGVWERLVRSVKTAMAIILKNRTLNDQLLLTVLTEAEASVNSRPLTVVSIDKDDPEAITPNCFLMGTTSVKCRPGSFSDVDLCLRKRWRHAQVLANHFWSRWLKEYLPSLALRSKWNKEQPDVVVGEIVFIPDTNELRNTWTMGRVEQVFPAKDGSVRVVDVRTASGVYRKPVAKLYRIPGWNNGDSKS